MLRPAIIRPFAIPPCVHQTGAFQLSQMSRHFRLDEAERISQVANAGLAAGQQIEQTQSGWLGQSFEQESRRAISWFAHKIHIRLSVYVSRARKCGAGQEDEQAEKQKAKYAPSLDDVMGVVEQLFCFNSRLVFVRRPRRSFLRLRPELDRHFRPERTSVSLSLLPGHRPDLFRSASE